MSGLIEGAVVGALVGKLFNEIIDATKTAGEFKPLLRSIESKIRLLRPEIEKMEKLLQKLDRGQENKDFAALLEKGTILARKCSKVRCWNVYERFKCSKLLSKLDESISSYCEINVSLQTNRTATQTLVVVEDLSRRLDEYISTGRSNVNESELGLSVSHGLHRPPEYTVGLEMPLKEVKMKLMSDEVKVLVIFGPGGCGKTTLAKKLCEDSDITGKYGGNLFFLTLSKVPNKMALDRLKLRCLRVDSKQPKLVILDDVWLESDHHIDDLSSGISNLKILVTSRFRLPRFRPQYELKLLNEEDAKKLFCHEVSFGNDSDNMPDDEDLMNKIVKCCNGFPLALSVVGKSLKGQHWTMWHTRAEEMSKGQAFPDSEEVLLNCLSTSLDDLDSVLKESFLDLGSFPEDARIPAAALVDIAVELYRQDEDGMYALRNLFQLHVRNLVNILATREDASKVGGFCNEHFVTQHDLLRQLAICVNNKHAPVEERARHFIDIAGNDVLVDFQTLEYKSSSARLVSITTDEAFTSNWMDMQLPKAEVLILNLTSKSYTLPDSMRKMNELKVLIVTNYGLFPTELENLEVIGALPNLKRIRFERISFSSLGRHSGLHFKNLKKASFVTCEFGRAMGTGSMQLPEMMPALEEIDINYCSDLTLLPTGICGIASVKRLSVTNCHNLSALPEELGRLSSLEILRLHACTNLVQLPNSVGCLQKLKLLDVSDCYSLEQLPETVGQLLCLKTLDIHGCASFTEFPLSVMDPVNIETVYCDEPMTDLWTHLGMHPSNLKVKVPKKEVNLNWL